VHSCFVCVCAEWGVHGTGIRRTSFAQEMDQSLTQENKQQGGLHMGCTQSGFSERRLQCHTGLLLIRRTWHNADGELHRTTGPALEDWAVIPSGAHVLSYQAWWQNGNNHREGQPAGRRWHVANDGTRVLDVEMWCRHGQDHRVGGPAYRHWTVEPNGTRRLARERWHVNGKLHHVDGPALDGLGFYWQDREVRREDLPWLRRGQGVLVPFAALSGATARVQKRPACRRDGNAFPAWSRDIRLYGAAFPAWIQAGSTTPSSSLYASAVGGAFLLCL